jgi:hypothetical protein
LLAISHLGCAAVGAPAATAQPHRSPGLTAGHDASTVSAVLTAQLQSMIQLALDDAARRSQRDAATLKVTSAEPVTWPDGSIGCPQPGRQYTQALVPGFRIRIDAGARILEYHASQRGQPFYCPPDRITGPTPADSRI